MEESQAWERLYSPLQIGDLRLRNRTIKTATYEGMTPDGIPSEALIRHHRDIAAGGIGMTTVAYCSVSADGRTFAEQMYMRPAVMPMLRKLTKAVHQEGAAAMLQLGHCGYFTKNEQLSSGRPLGPSRLFNPYGLMKGLVFSREMDALALQQTARDFAQAACDAKAAGFDAVELHLGHGYLLSQFLSPWSNRRRDAYGGDIEGRLRFPLEVVGAVREAVGASYPIFCKINLSDGFRGGNTVEEAVVIAQALARQGADALVLSGGFVSRSAFYLMRGGRPLEGMVEIEKNPLQRWAMRLFGPLLVKRYPFQEMFFLEQARRVRAAVDIPLVLLGGIVSRENLLCAMCEGFEMVALGRPLIYDPAFVRRIEQGEIERSGCDQCNGCVVEMDRQGVRCIRPDAPSFVKRRRVLLTGACGLLGRDVLRALLAQGNEVHALDLPTRANQRWARRFAKEQAGCRFFWGDIRDADVVRRAFEGCDAILHNAGIIPPKTEQDPALAYAVNVDATRQLIAIAEQMAPHARLLFASSFSLYGADASRQPPLRSDTPIHPSDHYTRQKAACEEMIRNSRLDWVILRIAAAMRADEPPRDPQLLAMLFPNDPTQRVEIVDTRDVASAQACAIHHPDACKKTLLIGGGPTCQVTFGALFDVVEEMLACGQLPTEAFGRAAYYTDWLDTSESQALLAYQHHSFADYRNEAVALTSKIRWLLRCLRPLVRWGLLRMSKPWRERTQASERP